MEFLQRGKEVILLDDENNSVTLESAVRLLAMSVYNDTYLFFNGKPDENARIITVKRLKLKMRLLDSLSNALSVVGK